MAAPSALTRLAVGIDLGTTHTVVAWAPLDGSVPPEIFPLPQLVTTTEVGTSMVSSQGRASKRPIARPASSTIRQS